MYVCCLTLSVSLTACRVVCDIRRVCLTMIGMCGKKKSTDEGRQRSQEASTDTDRHRCVATRELLWYLRGARAHCSVKCTVLRTKSVDRGAYVSLLSSTRLESQLSLCQCMSINDDVRDSPLWSFIWPNQYQHMYGCYRSVTPPMIYALCAALDLCKLVSAFTSSCLCALATCTVRSHYTNGAADII